VPTIGEWLSILEMTAQIILVPPYFENFGKRLIKSSKLYWGDFRAGLLSAGRPVAKRTGTIAVSGGAVRGLRGRRDSQEPGESGERKELYFFRDHRDWRLIF